MITHFEWLERLRIMLGCSVCGVAYGMRYTRCVCVLFIVVSQNICWEMSYFPYYFEVFVAFQVFLPLFKCISLNVEFMDFWLELTSQKRLPPTHTHTHAHVLRFTFSSMRWMWGFSSLANNFSRKRWLRFPDSQPYRTLRLIRNVKPSIYLRLLLLFSFQLIAWLIERYNSI